MNDDEEDELPPLSDAAPGAETAEIPVQAASPSPEAESTAASAQESKSRPMPTSA